MVSMNLGIATSKRPAEIFGVFVVLSFATCGNLCTTHIPVLKYQFKHPNFGLQVIIFLIFLFLRKTPCRPQTTPTMSARPTPFVTAGEQTSPTMEESGPQTPVPRRSGRNRRLNVLLQSVKRFRSPEARDTEAVPDRVVPLRSPSPAEGAPPKQSKAAKKRAKIVKDAQADLVRELAESGADNAARLASLLESAGASAPDSPHPVVPNETGPARPVLVTPPLVESLDAAKVLSGAFALSPSMPSAGPWASLFSFH